MAQPTPLQQYGVLLGEIQNAYVRAAKQIIQGFNAATKQASTLNPPPEEVLEQLRQSQLQGKINRERRLGMMHVNKLIAAERKHWGL